MLILSVPASWMAAGLQLHVPACRLLQQSCSSESKDRINYKPLPPQKTQKTQKKNKIAHYHILLNAFISFGGSLHLVLPYMEVTHSHLPSFMILVYYLTTM